MFLPLNFTPGPMHTKCFLVPPSPSPSHMRPALSTAAQRCALTVYFVGSQQDRVVFTGLTAEEVDRNSGTTTGHRLTCSCANVTGLVPLQWLDGSGKVLPDNMPGQLVDYRVTTRQPGSAVHLRINQDGFSCAEAGEYTCVVGSNTRTVLVTPLGEWASSCVCRKLELTAKVRRSALLSVSGCMYIHHLCRPELPAPPIPLPKSHCLHQ